MNFFFPPSVSLQKKKDEGWFLLPVSPWKRDAVILFAYHLPQNAM